MRVKRGKVKKSKHKKILKASKGYFLSYSKLYRRAREARLHAGEYNFFHRKKRAGQFKKIWIKQINAVCKNNGTSYSRFVNHLKQEGVKLDKKVLGYMAANHTEGFSKLVQDSLK